MSAIGRKQTSGLNSRGQKADASLAPKFRYPSFTVSGRLLRHKLIIRFLRLPALNGRARLLALAPACTEKGRQRLSTPPPEVSYGREARSTC